MRRLPGQTSSTQNRNSCCPNRNQHCSNRSIRKPAPKRVSTYQRKRFHYLSSLLAFLSSKTHLLTCPKATTTTTCTCFPASPSITVLSLPRIGSFAPFPIVMR